VSIKTVLRHFRDNNLTLPENAVAEITTCLEDIDNNLCGILQADVLAIIINIALQSGNTLEAERALCLIAVSHPKGYSTLSNRCSLLCSNSISARMWINNC
jgi:hypothetical protein